MVGVVPVRLPEIAPAAGVRGRVLIGAAFGEVSPVRHPSAPLLVDLELDEGAALELPPGAAGAAGAERGPFVISGELEVAGEPLEADRLAVLAPAARVRVTATRAARAMLIGGPPVGARLIEWNFVASSRARLDAARDAWKAQQFPKIPGDDQEFIPFPDLAR